MPNPTAAATAVSEVITLSPGVIVNGQPVTEARVRLLTRGDRAAAQKENEEAREDFLLTRQIATLGDSRDQTIIASAIEHLTTPDEARLRNALTELEAKFFLAPLVAAGTDQIVYPVSDIVSDEFALNPGIVIDGRSLTTCRVRLLTRGQWRAVQSEADGDGATLFYALAAIGGEVVQREWVDRLVDVDVVRINDKIEELREHYAPALKSGCPVCGFSREDAMADTTRGLTESSE